jgi:hypothetical protein
LLSPALVLSGLVAFPSPVSATGPTSPLAAETFVAVGSPPEIETVDAASGAVISTASLSYAPALLSMWTPPGTGDPEVVALESGYVQELDPMTGVVSAPIAATSGSSLAATGNSPYGLAVQASSTAQVEVVDLRSATNPGSVSLSLGGVSSMQVAMAPDGEYAYVTDPVAHKVKILSTRSASPYWLVASGYTGRVPPVAATVRP